MSNLRVGTIVNGEVIVVEDNLAYVSVGGKQEGRIYLDHYTSSKEVKSLKDVLKVGDQLRVQISAITGDGLVLLSRLEMEEREKRDKIIRKIMNHKPFTAVVTGKNKDGDYLVNKDGVNLYLPQKYVDLKEDFDCDSIINQEVKVVFVRSEQDERRTRMIVSRKQVQYNEERKARTTEFESINVDDVLKGTVSQFTQFGAFIKLQSIEALCHLSEISWYRIKEASEILTIGEEVEVKVIKKTESRIHVSIKALTKSPWEIFRENHKVGDEVECTVVKKSDTFMLCAPERDVVGILNQSDYSWKRDDNFAGSIEVGQKINLKITYLDKENNKMTLSKKHLEYNPWGEVNLKLHEVVTGSILRFTNTGAIVKVGEIEGFLSNRDASLDEKKQASEIFKVGDVVNAEVVKFVPQNWILTLSIRSIEEKEAQKYVDKYLEENVEAKQTLDDLFD